MPDNSASRLLNLLVRLQELSSPNRTTTEAWEIVLEVPVRTLDFDMQRAKCSQLVLDLQEDVRALEKSGVRVDRYLRAITDWSRFILTPEKGQGQAYDAAHVITESEIDHLSSLADVLDTRSPEVEPDPESVTSLYNQVIDLRNQIAESDDLDTDLRIFLVSKLNAIVDALTTIRIRGVRGLEEILGRTVLNASARPGLWERLAQSRFGDAFNGVLTLLANLATASESGVKILESAEKIRQITE